VTSVPDGAASCEFCAIARAEDSSAEVICRGTNWVAFFPLNPATPGHTLIIPRDHVSDLWTASLTLGGDLMAAAIRVGRAIKASLKPDGMNLISSEGGVAEQTVFHLHLHVVPRWLRDGFGDIWPPTRTYEDTDLTDVADRIRRECARTE
jgi:histidine triad (HIT) family protein